MDKSTDEPREAGLEERVLAALERFRPRLRSLLFRYRIPWADSEDVAQEVALVALRFAGASRDLDSWLFGVANNRCRLYWRSEFVVKSPR
jgi:DNA-directed RNA polymerase specialized sigma24 family protein